MLVQAVEAWRQALPTPPFSLLLDYMEHGDKIAKTAFERLAYARRVYTAAVVTLLNVYISVRGRYQKDLDIFGTRSQGEEERIDIVDALGDQSVICY